MQQRHSQGEDMSPANALAKKRLQDLAMNMEESAGLGEMQSHVSLQDYFASMESKKNILPVEPPPPIYKQARLSNYRSTPKEQKDILDGMVDNKSEMVSPHSVSDATATQKQSSRPTPPPAPEDDDEFADTFNPNAIYGSNRPTPYKPMPYEGPAQAQVEKIVEEDAQKTEECVPEF